MSPWKLKNNSCLLVHSLLTFPSGTSSIFENPKPVKHIMISATDEDCEVF